MNEAPRIVQLSQDVINKISAGEVIHQPCNVVKELLENSIDAGAKRISISLENGGFSCIKIVDNGSGIDKNDLPVACRRHTTSKLKKFTDLSRISTFGFRGEALFSMSCVSHLTITTKTQESDLALKAQYLNGEMVGKPSLQAGNTGTIVEVRDLFYNSPTKLRAIPDSSSQNKSILQIVTQYSVAFPDVSMIVLIDSKERLHTLGSSSSEDVISLIYGINASKSIFRVDADLELGAKAHLLLGTTESAKELKGSSIFINGRLVRCDKIRRAIEGVYSSFLMKGDKGFFVAILFIPPEMVDVNVHPTKRDVNFRNSDEIKESLCNVIYEQLKKRSSSRKFGANQQPIRSRQTTIDTSFSSQSIIESKTLDSSLSSFRGMIHSEIVTTADIEQVEEPQPDSIETPINDYQQSSESEDDSIPISIEMPDVDLEDFEMQPQEQSQLSTDSFFMSQFSQSTQKSQNRAPNEPIHLKKKPSTRMDLFEELKFEPIPSKLNRSDPNERTIEQLLSLSSTPKNDVITSQIRKFDLESVSQLKKQVASDGVPALISLFRRHVLVGLSDLCHAFIQCGDDLFICELFPLTRLFFYQQFLMHFGNYGSISFIEPIDINEVASCFKSTSINIASVLETHSKMLEDYFNIQIIDGKIAKMPLPLTGYTPSFIAMPLFLNRLATEIEWDYELECISGIIEELSMLYAILPEDEKDEEMRKALKSQLETIILPEMKTGSFTPNAELLHSKAIVKITDVKNMYTIFERT